MSRVLLLTVLFALLSLSFASLLSFPKSDIAADPSVCVNSCSNQGMCMQSGDASSCICYLGYLGTDCSVKTQMPLLCFLNSTICTHWAVQDNYLYERVWANASTAQGWAGIMWNATDGMSWGQSTILSVPSPYAPTAFDGYNVKKGKPMNLTQQSVAPQNVTGGATNSGIDVSFIRALDTGLPQHYTIPAMAGMPSTMSVAWASSFFEFHGKNAYFVKSIDIVGVASPAAEGAVAVHENKHKSRLARLIAPQ